MRKYLKNCKRLFPIYGSYERQFLKKLKNQIVNYMEENKEASYQDIVEQFGTPTEVVISYYDNVDEEALLRKTNLEKHVRVFLAVLILLVITFLGYRSYIIHQAYLDAQKSIIIYESTTIGED